MGTKESSPRPEFFIMMQCCGYFSSGFNRFSRRLFAKYTIDMFTKRNATLSREIKKLQESESELMRKKESGSQANQAAMEIIPTTQHILDNYDVLTIAEKNRLWKLVLKKATVYRTPEGELSVHIYPKIPK